MKKSLSKIISLFLCICLCAGLCGCDRSLGAMLTVKKMYKNLYDVSSISFDFKGSICGSTKGIDERVDLSGSCDCILNPFTMKIDAKADLGKMGNLNVPIYLAMENDDLMIYFGLTLGKEPVWMAAKINSEGEGIRIDVASIISIFENSTQAKSKTQADLREELARADEPPSVIKLTVELPGKIIMDAMGSDRMPPNKLENIPITIIADGESYMPMELEADLAPLLEYIAEEKDLDFFPDLIIKSAPVKIDVTGIDTIKSITLPDATKNAIAIKPPIPSQSPAPSPQATQPAVSPGA